MNRYASAMKCLMGTVARSAGLTAHAQTISLNGTAASAPAIAAATAAQVGGGGLQYACTPYSLASPFSNEQTFYFAPGANSEVVDKWTLLGDATPSAGYTNGMSGNTFKFAPTGFGKARVVVSYFYTSGTQQVYCPEAFTPIMCDGKPLTVPVRAYATRTFDFFKGFTQAQAGYSIKGPTCVPVDNPSVVYSVEAPVISTQSQIQAGLGADLYTWQLFYADGVTSVPGAPTQDGASYIIPGASLTAGSYTVKVKVGKCNSFSAPINVTVANDLNSTSTSALTNFPSCLPVGTVGSVSFLLNTVVGVNYTISSTNSAITVVQPSVAGTGNQEPIALSGFTATNSTIITIVGIATAGTCFGRQTIIKAIDRQLVAAQNVITPTCVPPSTNGVVLTLSNAPSGVTWGLPSGWTFVSQTANTVTVNTGTTGGNVTAVAGACNLNGGIITQAVKVKGPIAGCTFPVTLNTGACGSYISTITGPCATPGDPNNTGNRFVEWKLEELVAGTWTQRALNVPVGNLNFSNSTTFAWGTSIPAPNARVTVRVTNDNNCLDYPYVYVGSYTKCGPRPAPGPGNGGSSAPAAERVQVYPNPVGSQLSINLEANLSAGPATLTLLDALSRTVQTTTTAQPNSTLDVRQVPTGFYTLRVALPGGRVLTQPVQVQH